MSGGCLAREGLEWRMGGGIHKKSPLRLVGVAGMREGTVVYWLGELACLVGSGCWGYRQ